MFFSIMLANTFDELTNRDDVTFSTKMKKTQCFFFLRNIAAMPGVKFTDKPLQLLVNASIVRD